jgi:sulfite dehydrogenase
MRRISRRLALGGVVAGFATASMRRARASDDTADLGFANGIRSLVAYPQKRKLLRHSTRPPQLETPFAVFDEAILTPNDAFYVNYHVADIPFEALDPDLFRVRVKGQVGTPRSFTLADLRKLPTQEHVAVLQAAGNGRGYFQPRVTGPQIGNGMMGNARWCGVALKHLLDRVGIAAGAVQVRFDGMDSPTMPGTPDYAKALDIDVARNGDVMLAWAMNDADLPIMNGYPLRLVVPGWYGAYWIKHVNEITVLDKRLANYWTAAAYRVPDDDCACVAPGAAPSATRPVGRLNVRSFFTCPAGNTKVPQGLPVKMRGIAFDGGSGIGRVELSADGGQSWQAAHLGVDHGRYAFRQWQTSLALPAGRHQLLVRATARSGETQPMVERWNPGGYMRNLVESVTVTIG